MRSGQAGHLPDVKVEPRECGKRPPLDEGEDDEAEGHLEEFSEEHSHRCLGGGGRPRQSAWDTGRLERGGSTRRRWIGAIDARLGRARGRGSGQTPSHHILAAFSTNHTRVAQ